MLYIVSRVAPLTAAAAHYSVLLSHSSPSKQYYTCGISEKNVQCFDEILTICIIF